MNSITFRGSMFLLNSSIANGMVLDAETDLTDSTQPMSKDKFNIPSLNNLTIAVFPVHRLSSFN